MPNHTAGGSLEVAQVALDYDDQVEPFGRTTSSPLKRSLAVFTNSSLASWSLIFRRTHVVSSDSKRFWL